MEDKLAFLQQVAMDHVSPSEGHDINQYTKVMEAALLRKPSSFVSPDS